MLLLLAEGVIKGLSKGASEEVNDTENITLSDTDTVKPGGNSTSPAACFAQQGVQETWKQEAMVTFMINCTINSPNCMIKLQHV